MEDKKFHQLQERYNYMSDILAGKNNENLRLLASRLEELSGRLPSLGAEEAKEAVKTLEDLFNFVEKKIEAELTPMDKVRIVRNPQRICLRDILENVYDNYTEIGSMGEHSIDPAMLIARAYITRRQGKRTFNQSVMVIGHEKGHGEEIRNGGSASPWGNAKALHYMKVAETENIPIHAFVFTPGSFPVEDSPGAAQQIAKNLYEMSNLRVPVLAVISEGGSGGAEAIGLADRRLMFSHGYYSVISPEGGAAIEGNVKRGPRATPELIEKVAENLRLTADDNLRMGYIDGIIQEPELGARCHHFDFLRQLRQEVLRATDEIVLEVRGVEPFRSMARRSRSKKTREGLNMDTVHLRWNLSPSAQERLVERRHKKFRGLAQQAFLDHRTGWDQFKSVVGDAYWEFASYVRYDLLRRRQQNISNFFGEMKSETSFFLKNQTAPFRRLFGKGKEANGIKKNGDAEKQLTTLSDWSDDSQDQRGRWAYISPKAKEDKAVVCPNSATHGCLDMWARDLYGEFAGVCTHCGHHFPMEYQWYLYNVFDHGSIREFNGDAIEAQNPLDYEGFSLKLEKAKAATGLKSSCMTFEARLHGINTVVAMLVAPFRGGSVGAAEGEKFILASERASKKRLPFLAYVHGTAGIRIQEGVNGVIQMPRCTMAVRRYIDAGGLYLVVYDTNSYAGPVASFLGCSPYQFGIRSSNVGFAGPGVIQETTGSPIEPHYHSVYKALARGHIQGIWDRREMRFNLHQSMLTMGGRNLYYK